MQEPISTILSRRGSNFFSFTPITYEGILSGSFDGEKYRTSSNSLIWFEGQENPSSRIPKYGSFEYSFKNLELKNLKVGKSIEVIVEGRDYLASFREAARCKRIR